MFKEIYNFIKNNKWYVLLIIGSLGLYFYKFHGELSSESEKWDHFGSYIGGIFSAVTLLSVLHGMQLERKHFNEQKLEFDKERKKQEERRRKEEFERTFFMMLEQHNETLRFLENKDNGTQNVRTGMTNVQTIEKRSIVDNVYYYIVKNINDVPHIDSSIKNDVNYADINAYFINLYRILKFIYKNKEMNIDNEYSSLLRSFLSRKILLILAYHLCGQDDYNEYKFYIKEFSFFEHLDFIEIEKSFIRTCVFDLTDFIEVYDNIEYIFQNFNSERSEELISYIDNSGNYSGDGYEFLKNIILIKKGEHINRPIMKEIHFNCVRDHLFVHIIKNLDKNSFLGNKAAECAYDLYYDFIMKEAK